MSPGHRRTSRRALVAVLFLALAAWFLPSLVSVERYRRRLEAGLEQALKRPVDFGAVSLRLLPRPGFVIENVVVHEDPRFGIEPFAASTASIATSPGGASSARALSFPACISITPRLTSYATRRVSGTPRACCAKAALPYRRGARRAVVRPRVSPLTSTGRASTSRSARTKSLSPSRTFAPNSASSRRAVCCAIAWSEGRFAPI